MQNLADIVMGTVQYNEEGVLMSIHEVCDVITNRSEAYVEEMEAYNRLVKLAQVWWTHFLRHLLKFSIFGVQFTSTRCPC